MKRGAIYHAGSKTRVLNVIEHYNEIVEMVDEDLNNVQPRQLNQFTLKDADHDLELRIWRTNFLVVVKPRMEDWVLKAAKQEKIEVENVYGLQVDPDELRGEIDLTKFTKLVEDLNKRNLLT